MKLIKLKISFKNSKILDKRELFFFLKIQFKIFKKKIINKVDGTMKNALTNLIVQNLIFNHSAVRTKCGDICMDIVQLFVGLKNVFVGCFKIEGGIDIETTFHYAMLALSLLHLYLILTFFKCNQQQRHTFRYP